MTLDIENFFKKNELQDSDKIAVGVSGGADSMALAHMLGMWAKENNKKLYVLTVDHGLRVEAKDEVKEVARWVAKLKAEKIDITHHVLTWEGKKPDTAIMERARAARYELMAEHCRMHDIPFLFLAHHQDDQAETFLIRLSKGSGLDGLSSMGEARCYDEALILLRPLLAYSKEDLLHYCKTHDIPYVNDPSNKNKEYMRPRLRASMIILGEEGLTSKRLARTAKRLARARKALEQISLNLYDQCLKEQEETKIIFDFVELKKNPEEIALRVVQKALESMRPNADYGVRMERLEELFAALWQRPESFKPRTLGGCVFALKDKNTALWIEKEHS